MRPTARFVDESGKPKPHVAGLGETLYTDHLITVELAGALLFVALIAALSIAAPKPPVRPGDAPGQRRVGIVAIGTETISRIVTTLNEPRVRNG